MGRPTKFNKKIKDKIQILAYKGHTDKEIAKIIWEIFKVISPSIVSSKTYVLMRALLFCSKYN
jgi:hypothetical protein